MSKRLVLALASVLCALVVAAPVQAKTGTERIVGGHATLTRSAQVTAFLRSRGITVTPLGAAKGGSGSLTMPMVGGQMQVPTMQGTMVTGGGVEYSKGSRHVELRDFKLVHAGQTAKLTAILRGHRILIGTMVAPTTHMSGNTGTMTGGLELSAAFAHLINHLVGMHVVQAGEDLGDLSATMKMG